MADEDRIIGGEEKPVTIIVKGPIGVRLENEIITALQTIKGPGGKPVAVSGSGAGAMSVEVLVEGKTASGAKEPLRLDDQRLLRNRPYEPYRTQAVTNLGAAWATVYTCPANSIARAVVIFGQTTAGTATFEAALRVKGCALTVGNGYYIYPDAPPPMLGPFTLAAGDIIEAYRVAGANGAVLVDVELYSTGDVNTGT